MDVFIQVFAIEEQTADHTKLTVKWWNHGWTGNPYELNIFQTIKVPKADYDKWQSIWPFDDPRRC